MSGRRRPQRPNLLAELPPISYVWETPNRRPRRPEWDIPDPAALRRLTPRMRAKLERIVSRAPEVMVKITGRTKGVAHLKSHLAYITRNGELDAETEQGAAMTGRVGLKDLQQRWADDAALDDKRRRDGSLSINIILSMPAGTDAIAVKDSARAFAIETFGDNHDYVFVQHLDDKHPHVHLTVRSLGHDGRRLNPRKADLQAWRERFAAELRLRGIAAEATPRRTRGRVRKADRGAVLALRKRKITPEVDRLAREEVLQDCRTSLGRADQVTSGRDPAAIPRLRGRAAGHGCSTRSRARIADSSIRRGDAGDGNPPACVEEGALGAFQAPASGHGAGRRPAR